MRQSGSGFAAGELTRLLRAWSRGDPDAGSRLMPLVHRELRRRAAAHLRRDRPNHTLRPTEVVHEAYLRLCEQNVEWENREHFYAIAAHIMRRVLVDHARARGAVKRDRRLLVAVTDDMVAVAPPDVDLIALDEALTALAEIDPRPVRLIELRFFSGLTMQEAARVLKISRATADRDWAVARAWLHRRLESRTPSE